MHTITVKLSKVSLHNVSKNRLSRHKVKQNTLKNQNLTDISPKRTEAKWTPWHSWNEEDAHING